MAQASALPALKELSARLGRDITRTQGAGGNTSVKADGTMWVKASGTWLAQAEEKEIFVPVAVAPLVSALEAGDIRADKATDFVVEELNASRLRPSIETSVHAVMPQPVVAHFHCVNTIAHAVRSDAEEVVSRRMSALPHLRWGMIPYRRPGMPLAREIALVAKDGPDVLVLRNHGIIIAGESVEEVDERIEAVTSALAAEPRKSAAPDPGHLSGLASGSQYRLPDDEATHRVALDPDACRIARSGSLYPDHVIFLGTELGLLEGQSLGDLLKAADAAGKPHPKMILDPGRGVLVSKELSPGGLAMARCLAEVALRIDPQAPVDYLDSAQEYELTHWEAEQYRQKLDRAGN
ncbi:class II aldolase/adducin family protein [Chelativorans sp. AA-79]|uniref:class II aldolase/adducin family protein n=1 Tax=Chelativorans sp. AA-79 TaxID=3028735 RepID=UPI0023F84613|nr:class II aldolase/adducin family protein [Chelativorans sp. AA-79]WEX08371.1 class II aldolase/adducin family protein [Chelativorans sp. AA-79]